MKRLSGLIIALAVCTSLGAQTAMDRYRDSINARYNRYRTDVNARYENFRDSCNAAYAKVLAKAWGTIEGRAPIEAPKEEMRLPEEVLEEMRNPEHQIMQVQEAPTAAFSVRGIISSVRNFFKGLQPPEPMVKKRERPKEETEKPLEEYSQKQEKPLQEDIGWTSDSFTFDFYGTKMKVDMAHLRDSLHLPSATPANVSGAWTLCSRPRYEGLIQDCLALRDEYKLGDWGYLQMLRALGNAAFGEDSNESTFLAAYIFCQSGYRIRLGEDEGRLMMLYDTRHSIYGRSYWIIGQRNFYTLTGDLRRVKTIHTCEEAINQREQPLSLMLMDEPRLESSRSKSRVVRSFKYPEMQMTVSVNENLIRYFNDYPSSQIGDNALTRWAIYANTPLADEVKQQIYPYLKEKLQGLPADEQVCRLLSLVQPRHYDDPETSLVYGLDEKAWGRDRAFFAEETLFYPYSDCEDHAILFSRLVRDLLGLDVLLVYYSTPGSAAGHLATAVRFDTPPSMGNGNAFRLDDKLYYVCDPTNWDPRPGVTMKGMDNNTAQVILLQ